MKSSILVTGVGAVIGQGILRSLKGENLSLKLVGIDANPFSAGSQWADVFYPVPKVDDPSWLEALVDICNKEKIVLILPGIEQDVKALLKNRGELIEKTSAFPLLNSSEAFRVGFDKWELYRFAGKHDIKVPQTWLANDVSNNQIKEDLYPLLLKPREGMAGKGIYKVKNKGDFDYWFSHINKDDYIVQQSVGCDDDEYTVSIFGYHDGTFSEPLSLKRKLNYGSTFEAETVNAPELSKEVIRIAKELKIIGPTNFQFRKVGKDYLLLEVNPRFSSSTSIKTAFGLNESVMAIESFIFGKAQPSPDYKKGKCARYVSDYIEFV